MVGHNEVQLRNRFRCCSHANLASSRSPFFSPEAENEIIKAGNLKSTTICDESTMENQSIKAESRSSNIYLECFSTVSDRSEKQQQRSQQPS